MVTPNLHHMRIVRASPVVAEPYNSAALSLADGWPVAWVASRVAGRRVGRVSGADFFQTLICQPGQNGRLLLIGGTAGPHLDKLVERCRATGWQVTSEPAPRAELDDPRRRLDLVARSADAATGGIVVIGVGAPLQEQLATEIAAGPGCGVILCLGMSINFSSGFAQRAPRLAQILRLEWAFRALSEPRRLLVRYAKDSLVLPSLLRENRHARSKRRT
ncbi:WecB/TagA/CpsF family glycosyltransferase [Mycolicibacterium sp. P1-18]|uniref:WecB/TagA/CpsF family glycosyltransferase n=1 Tax=Mycolicibacterium sp. P1-18 TaxID=2024615 RepID=UPI00351A9797